MGTVTKGGNIIEFCPFLSQRIQFYWDIMTKHDEIRSGARDKVAGAYEANACVSEKLRHFYQSVQEEGIPDRFLTLLDRLGEVEREASKAALVTGASQNGR
ncbi:MAG: NepR family anti-sigma factor [Allorhizobium sp.]